MASEVLDFTLRPVESYEDLLKACEARAKAYGHKVPAYRVSMMEPDSVDLSPWTMVFLCESKSTGETIGSMRVQTTTRADSQLEIEKYIEAPAIIPDFGRAEISRLSAIPNADPMVRVALWKAAYLACKASQVGCLIVGVRKKSLIRIYEEMGFKDIYDDRRFVPLGYAGNAPHRIMAIDVVNVERNWIDTAHPLASFFFNRVHPDIQVISSSMQRHATEKVRLHVV